jgi:hypothetical protein
MKENLREQPEAPRRTTRDVELESAMRRFFDLPPADQLRAFERMCDYLGAGAPKLTKADKQIEDRAASLVALARVVDHLGLDGSAPTTAQFDRVAREFELGWTSAKIVRVWGRWRFACAVLLGDRPRRTAAQQALRDRSVGFARSREDYLTAVRLWLATKPAKFRSSDYDLWAREYNDLLADDEIAVPGHSTIREGLALSWPDVVAVGRGEMSVDEAERKTRSPHADWSVGPHDLVGQLTGAQILKLGTSQFQRFSRQPGFPTAVLIFNKGTRPVRTWLRGDLEMYRDTGKAPAREENGLRFCYYRAQELAPLLGVRRGTLTDKTQNVPPPTGRVAGICYWLKRDADRWIRENKALIELRVARPSLRRVN